MRRGSLCPDLLTDLPEFSFPQLGFGSFLGLVGLTLVENRRQMVSKGRYPGEGAWWKRQEWPSVGQDGAWMEIATEKQPGEWEIAQPLS